MSKTHTMIQRRYNVELLENGSRRVIAAGSLLAVTAAANLLVGREGWQVGTEGDA